MNAQFGVRQSARSEWDGDTIRYMALLSSTIGPLILDELSRGERRILSLVVAIGRELSRIRLVKGDITATVKSTLRTLVASGMIVDTDGIYTLSPRIEPAAPPPEQQAAVEIVDLPALRPPPSRESRNMAATRRNAVKVEQYLTEVERAQGCATAWNVRQRLELGHTTLEELKRR
jgi:hypothetical protein